MKKLARAIVRMRRLILIAAVLLLIPAAVGYSAVSRANACRTSPEK